jgi:hypothetical protein
MTMITAIQNVHIFDGLQFRDSGTVFINQDIISFQNLNPTSVVNGSGGYLIPGLIDSHVHVLDVSALRVLTSFGIMTALSMARASYSLEDTLRDQAGLASWYTAGIPAIAPNTTHAKMPNFSSAKLINNTSQVSEMVTEAFENGSDFYKIVAEPNGPSQEMQDLLVKSVHEKGKKVMTHASDFESFTRLSIPKQMDCSISQMTSCSHET